MGALLLALLAYSMREASVKGASLVLLSAGVMLLVPLVTRLSSLVSVWRDFAEKSTAAPYVASIVKVMGVGYLTHFAADTCRESGAASLSARVELCGKLEILLICLPYIQELLTYAVTVAGG